MRLSALICFCICATAEANVLDPVADYKDEKKLGSSDILYRWEGDINGDGKDEVFLELRESFKEDRAIDKHLRGGFTSPTAKARAMFGRQELISVRA